MHLYIIISIVTIIGIIFFIKKKSITEGIGVVNVNEQVQPDVDKSLYDFNLEQAEKIWQNVGCTDGTKKPTASNDHWLYEEWEMEADAYKKESDKLHEEHNYYDWSGEITGEQEIVDKGGNKVFPIGIREANIRCHGGDLGNYKMPKPGDRVKKKKSPTTNTQLSSKDDYYTGIVLEGDNEKTLALWDSFGNDDNNEPDEKKFVTKDVPAEVLKTNSIANKIQETIDKFGWPEWEWKRNPERGGQSKKESQKTSGNNYKWLNNTSHYSDAKELYKMTECKEDTECDQLKCSKRKKYVLSQYPITYICDGDIRNESNDKWYCKAGSGEGRISTYFDKSKMCRKYLKPRNVPQTYCNETCGGTRNCIPFKNVNHIKNKLYKKNKCYATVHGKNSNNEPAMTIIVDGKKITPADIKNKGVDIIEDIKVYGNDCSKFIDGKKEGMTNFNTVELATSNRVKLFSEYNGVRCGLKAFPHIQQKQYNLVYNATFPPMRRNAFWRCCTNSAPDKYKNTSHCDSDIFIWDVKKKAPNDDWEKGKLVTTNQYMHPRPFGNKKCALEMSIFRGKSLENNKGVYSKERNAKFDCLGDGETFVFTKSTGAFRSEKKPKCGLEYTAASPKKSWLIDSSIPTSKIAERQAKFDCNGAYDKITMKKV
jgi:hypothetical protein